MQIMQIDFDIEGAVQAVRVQATSREMVQVERVLGDDTPFPLGGLRLTVAQAAKLAVDSGRWTLRSSPDWDATLGIYECLAIRFFGLFWGRGVRGYLAGEPSR